MFDIATATDLYAALVQDFDEYMDETHSARRALHCAITACHLREWVWHDWLEHDPSARSALGVQDESSFNGWVNRSCPWFPILRDLVNGTKHFEERQSFETMRVIAMPFAWGQASAGGAKEHGVVRSGMLRVPCLQVFRERDTFSLISGRMRANIDGYPQHTCSR